MGQAKKNGLHSLHKEIHQLGAELFGTQIAIRTLVTHAADPAAMAWAISMDIETALARSTGSMLSDDALAILQTGLQRARRRVLPRRRRA